MNVDIIIQGGVWPITNKAIEQYTKLPFVNKVILSTWDNEKLLDTVKHNNIITQPLPENAGQCNINLQILSTKAGVDICNEQHVIKCRSDQLIYDEEFIKIFNFYQQSIIDHNYNIQCIDNSECASPIYVWGLNNIFPYSFQDHFCMGRKLDISRLFSCPLSPAPVRGHTVDAKNNHYQRDQNLDWDFNDLRPNIYLGAHYCSKFSKKARLHIENYKKFLTDKAAYLVEAQNESERIRDIIFKTLPRTNIFWHKTVDNKYPFDLYTPQGEYYYD